MKGWGKAFTLGSKIVAVLFLIGAFIGNGLGEWGYAAWDIVQIGLAIALLGSPVDISIIIANLKAAR